MMGSASMLGEKQTGAVYLQARNHIRHLVMFTRNMLSTESNVELQTSHYQLAIKVHESGMFRRLFVGDVATAVLSVKKRMRESQRRRLNTRSARTMGSRTRSYTATATSYGKAC